MADEKIKLLSETVFKFVKDYIDELVAGANQRIDSVRDFAHSLPMPKDGKDGDPGAPGKDAVVDYEVIAEEIHKGVNHITKESITEAIASIALPKDGKDGASGLPGKDGEKGESGEKGADGINGKDGIEGKQGVPGIPGKDGEKGEPGERGVDGINGKDGEKGDWGEKGITGKDGEKGERGEKGADGINGKDGVEGKQGASGIPGKDGEKGERGEKGADGINGKDGIEGKQGQDGISVPGLPGKDGEKGERGENGSDGINGKDGVDGRDADPINYKAVNNLIRDLVAQNPPKQGVPGEQGEKGADGVNGRDGIPGDKGLDGVNGADGRDGRDGKDGSPGRDALRIDLQEGVDGTRGYPKGTYAAYRGGTICAQRYTDPLVQEPDLIKAGWIVVLEGIADFSCSSEDGGRTEVKATTLTGGRVLVQKTKTHMMIQRGLFEIGKLYERGDTVTFQGSQWHAEKLTDKSPETMPEYWKLIAKKGRDGKERVLQNDRGKPGPITLK